MSAPLSDGDKCPACGKMIMAMENRPAPWSKIDPAVFCNCEAKRGALTSEELQGGLADDTEGLYGFRWSHYRVLEIGRGNAAIAAVKATDFRIRAYYQRVELLLEELMHRIEPYMAANPRLEHEGGEAWREYEAWKASNLDAQMAGRTSRGETGNG